MDLVEVLEGRGGLGQDRGSVAEGFCRNGPAMVRLGEVS